MSSLIQSTMNTSPSSPMSPVWSYPEASMVRSVSSFLL